VAEMDEQIEWFADAIMPHAKTLTVRDVA
jgi:hypothetical protein